MRLSVDRVETFVIRVPERTDFRWLSLSRPLGEFVLARVEADGIVGWGEVVGLRDWGDADGRRHGETPSTITAIVHEQLAPGLIGRSVGLGELAGAMDALVVGNPYSKALVDIALHDAAGRASGVPVHTLLGGAARETIVVAHMLGIMPLDETLEEARTAIQDGVIAFQVKGGADIDRDVAVIRALREEHGPDVWLRLDANTGYRGRAGARRALERLADAGADLVEQPLFGAAALAEVRAQSPVPIMADEACWTPGDALDLVARRAVDAVSVYVGKAGGLARAREVCAIARAADLPHDLNGALELGIGNAANLHVAIASPAELLPCVVPVNAPAGAFSTVTAGRYFQDDVITEPWTLDAGRLSALTGPGLGVEVDVEKVKHYCIEHRETAANVGATNG